MSDLSIDPVQLRTAATRLDQLFTDATTALSRVDDTINGCGTAWTGPAEAAFTTFTRYLADRRITLQRNLATTSESLTTTADTFRTRDTTTASAITGQSGNAAERPR